MRQLQQTADIGRVCGLHPETNSKKTCLEPRASYSAVLLTIRNWKQNKTKKQTPDHAMSEARRRTSALFLSQVYLMHSRWAWHIWAHRFAGVQDASGACREADFEAGLHLVFLFGGMFCTSTSMSYEPVTLKCQLLRSIMDRIPQSWCTRTFVNLQSNVCTCIIMYHHVSCLGSVHMCSCILFTRFHFLVLQDSLSKSPSVLRCGIAAKPAHGVHWSCFLGSRWCDIETPRASRHDTIPWLVATWFAVLRIQARICKRSDTMRVEQYTS